MAKKNRQSQIDVTVNATAVGPGLEGVEKAVTKTATTVSAQGKRGGDGLDQIGAGAKRAAAQVEAETSRIQKSLERLIVAQRSGGPQSAESLALRITQKGLDPAAFAGQLEALRQVEAAGKAAGKSVEYIGLSAKQASASLRDVPAQFTDIVTSLQAGQNPLQVFLQQGGQLKDVFGGAGNAARALGGYVGGLITPLNVAAAGVVALGAAYVVGSNQSAEFVRTVVLSGGAAGVTADQIARMARSLEAAGSGNASKAGEILSAMAASGRIGADNLERFTAAALQLEKVGGQSAAKTAEAFEDLAKKPLEAALKLNEAQNFLSASTYKTIKTLVDQGQSVKAAQVAQEAYAKSIEDRAPVIAASLGFVQRGWQAVSSATKQAFSDFVAFGNNTASSKIADIQGQLDLIPKALRGFGLGKELSEKYEGQIANLREIERLQQRAAAADAARAQAVRALADADASGLFSLGAKAEFEKKSVEARTLGLAAGKTELQITQAIAELRKKILGGEDGNAKADIERQVSLLNELSGLSSSYARDVADLVELRKKGLVTEEQFGNAARNLLEQQPLQKEFRNQQEADQKKLNNALEGGADAHRKYLTELEKGLATGDKNIEQLRQELVELGLGKEALAARVALRLEEQAAVIELQALRAFEKNLDGAEYAAQKQRAEQLREEAALRKELAAAVAGTEVAKANTKAAEDAGREWVKITDQVGQALADSLINGGKSATETLRNLFKTLVLRPILQSAGNSFASSLGLAGAGGQQGQGFNFVGSAAQSGRAWLDSVFSSRTGNASGATNAALIDSYAGTSGYGASSASPSASAAASANIYAAIVQAALSRGSVEFARGWTAEVARNSKNNILGKDAIGQSFSRYSVDNVLTVFGQRIGLSDKWASVLSGATAVAQLIGRQAPKTTGAGIIGTISGGDVTGQAFQDWFAKGGFFRSSKSGTNLAALDPKQDAALNAATRALYKTVGEWAEVLDLPTDKLAQVTQEFRVQLGDNAEANQKAIAEELAKYTGALSNTFKTAVSPFAKAGEDVEETLQRLAGLQVFSKDLNSLGSVFSQVAELGFDAKESLFAMVGGIERFGELAQGFVQNYFGRDEIAGIKAREVKGGLASLGLGDVSSKDEFRKLVEGSDTTTDQGRERLATLLGLQDAFAQVAEYLQESGLTLAAASAQAPESSVLQSLLNRGPQDVQVDAIRDVGSGINLVREAIEQLTEVVRDNRGQVTPVYYEVDRP